MMTNYKIVEDCTSSDCGYCLYNWQGKASLAINDQWGSGMCLNFEVINTNAQNKPALSYFLQVKTCGVNMTASWGNIHARYLRLLDRHFPIYFFLGQAPGGIPVRITPII